MKINLTIYTFFFLFTASCFGSMMIQMPDYLSLEARLSLLKLPSYFPAGQLILQLRNRTIDPLKAELILNDIVLDFNMSDANTKILKMDKHLILIALFSDHPRALQALQKRKLACEKSEIVSSLTANLLEKLQALKEGSLGPITSHSLPGIINGLLNVLQNEQ